MISNAENLETLLRGRAGVHHLKVTIPINSEVFSTTDKLDGIPVAVTKKGYSQWRRRITVVSAEQLTTMTNPSTIKGARHREDSTFFAIDVVNDPALGYLTVVALGTAGLKTLNVIPRLGDGQGLATLLESQVTTLSQVSHNFLEAILEEQSVVHVFLFAIRYRRARVPMTAEALPGSNIIALVVDMGSRSLRNMRKRIVRLL